MRFVTRVGFVVALISLTGSAAAPAAEMRSVTASEMKIGALHRPVGSIRASGLELKSTPSQILKIS